jgi:hypothetical protein
VTASHDDVYAVLRESVDGNGLLLVNLSDLTVESTVSVIARDASLPTMSTDDLLGTSAVTWVREGDGDWTTSITLEPYQAAAYDLVGMR